MFDTVAQVAFAVALILPGFLVVQLSERRRPATPAGGDLELVLRGLAYALIIQAVAGATGWLPSLVEDLEGGDWQDHASALSVYALVVCVIVPTAIGLALGAVLRQAEGAGALKWWHYALGGRDARRAWDYMFGCHDGSWLRVYLKPDTPGAPVIVGKYGKESWASQTPANPDLYLQEVWLTTDGQITEEDLERGGIGGVWVEGGDVARIEVVAQD